MPSAMAGLFGRSGGKYVHSKLNGVGRSSSRTFSAASQVEWVIDQRLNALDEVPPYGAQTGVSYRTPIHPSSVNECRRPGSSNRPKRVNAQATRIPGPREGPRTSSSASSTACSLPGTRMKPSQRRTSPRRLLSGRSNAQPGNAETLPSNSVGTRDQRHESNSRTHAEMVPSPTTLLLLASSPSRLRSSLPSCRLAVLPSCRLRAAAPTARPAAGSGGSARGPGRGRIGPAALPR